MGRGDPTPMDREAADRISAAADREVVKDGGVLCRRTRGELTTQPHPPFPQDQFLDPGLLFIGERRGILQAEHGP